MHEDKIEVPDFDSLFDFGGSDFEGDIFSDGFFEFDFGEEDSIIENRFIKPRIKANMERFVSSDNATKLAQEIHFQKGDRVDCYVTGNFVFGDFIEAFMLCHDVTATKMTIATLSMNADNIGMLISLLNNERVQKMDLLISHYFYANERGRGGFIPLIQETLGQDDRFSLAVASIHTKICTFETTRGNKIVMHGSANLRSSSNIEAFTIEDNPQLYDFYEEIHAGLIEKYNTINKAVRGKTLHTALKELAKKYNDKQNTLQR